MEARRALLKRRDLEDFTDRWLLAMHELRSVLVRKKAERVNRDQSR